MKNKLLLFLLAGILFSCNKNNDTQNLKNELDKWQQELVLNGEVGPKCNKEDIKSGKWLNENNGCLYGLDTIKSIESDFNSDKIKDGFYYFSPANCAGGNSSSRISDYGMLVYSNKGQLLTNKNITSKIEDGIKIEIYSIQKGEYQEVVNVILNYLNFNNVIEGKFEAYLDSDAECCPSFMGTFEYNPIKRTVKLNLNGLNEGC